MLLNIKIYFHKILPNMEKKIFYNIKLFNIKNIKKCVLQHREAFILLIKTSVILDLKHVFD